MKKKVVVLMPVHCVPKVAMMTLGSWLEATDGTYEAEIIVGVHENYHDYHDGLESIQSLPVRIVKVPEINWYVINHNDALIRYSMMHAKNMQRMLQTAGNIGFDHLAIIDHDLVFKKDFIGWAMGESADLIGSFMEDRINPVMINTHSVGQLLCMPKFSIWHLLMSDKFYVKIMENENVILPKITDGRFYDTFSEVIEKNSMEWGLNIRNLSCAQMTDMINHLWSMSFNFGSYTRGKEDYIARIKRAEDNYDARFPNGIHHLFGKVGL